MRLGSLGDFQRCSQREGDASVEAYYKLGMNLGVNPYASSN